MACNPELDPRKKIQWQGESNQYDILGHSWIVHSASGAPTLSADATDLDGWKQFAPNDHHPIPSKLKFRIDPQQRPKLLEPSIFAVDASGPPKTTPGADPERVGPWSKE